MATTRCATAFHLGDLLGKERDGLSGLVGDDFPQFDEAGGNRGDGAIVGLGNVINVLTLSQLIADLLIFGARPRPASVSRISFLSVLLCKKRRQGAVESLDALWLAASGVSVERFAGSWIQSVGQGADGGDGFLKFHDYASRRSMAEENAQSL
jgi:hypothetical protein